MEAARTDTVPALRERCLKVKAQQARMNRLYAVESTPTVTGAMADHRLSLRAGLIEGSFSDMYPRCAMRLSR